jgi:hypothetical protein
LAERVVIAAITAPPHVELRLVKEGVGAETLAQMFD